MYTDTRLRLFQISILKKIPERGISDYFRKEECSLNHFMKLELILHKLNKESTSKENHR